MRFWIMLLILGWRLRYLAKHHEKFQQKIADQDFVMQFTTEKGWPSRWFYFHRGQVSVSGGKHQKPAISISFASAKDAYGIIVASAKDQTVMMKAMQEQKVKIAGDLSKLMWFMSVAKYLGPAKKKKK